MALPNIFTKSVADTVIQRINNLTPTTQGQWGKMAVAQMLAHCCVPYEMLYEDIHPRPSSFVRFILKLIAKKGVVNEVPYPKNSRTAPAFVITDDKNFEDEKNRLIEFIKRTQALGDNHFDGKESHSFGNLTKTEWNNLFYKHLDHHLTQFGV
jgi:Protein of unknown function (DUF1569)